MKRQPTLISSDEINRQKEIINKIRMQMLNGGRKPFAFVETYGCQQNSSDSEKIKGMLYDMGFDFCEKPANADFIIYNTCAVRENAELRVFGNIGALKNVKRKNPDVIIAVCGC
ncbi:MAG: tRNA (N6-isopentenyl adenosine(37)-C2)-methylthiotransferase MiaB, partial [Clostridia bacterium]|nr:tRNA (N6-isopentenyl adenosine(37)-C2)-methylthiotransferase MiaB [Clostridia bacterium]